MKLKISRALASLAAMLLLLTGPALAVLTLPGVQGVASASQIPLSSSDQKKVNDKCKSTLGKKAGKLAVQACVTGYILGLEKTSKTSCDAAPYKGHKDAVDACKNTGYDLGKKNAAGVTLVKATTGPKNPSPTCTGSSCSPTPTGGGSNCDSSSCDLVALYVNPFIRLLSIIVGLVVAASLIMGGIQYSSSSGDPQKASAAKSRISNTLLALFAYALLYAFLNFLIPGGIFH